MIINPVSLVIGLVFSPLAALMAFFITYDEYLHHYSDKKKSLKLALQTGVFSFMFFMILSLIIGFIFK